MVNFSWDKPKCLIYSDKSGLKLNGSTLDLLQTVKVKVTVVTITGPYRSGKSYLMNRLAGQNTGFEIGSTIQAHTKGIWAWCRPHPQDPNTCLLLLDTEGLGDPEKGDKDHDAWILTLAVLLSTVLVYNNIGPISQDALLDLHLVTKMSEHVQIRSRPGDHSQNFSEFFPSFVWTIRDFYLDLIIDGMPCTPDEYMEKMLELKKGDASKINDYNEVRKCVKGYFPSRKCFVFPRPVNDMNKLKKPESLTDSDFDQKFLQISESFIVYILGLSIHRKKTISGATLTGSALAGLCEQYVATIQNGGIPCIENSVEVISKRENAKAVEEAVTLYKTEMGELRLPTETVEELASHHQLCEKTALAAFMNRSMFDIGQCYQAKLVETILIEYKAFTTQNEKSSAANCRIMLNQLYSQISYKLQSGHYVKPGGYEMYKNDMAVLQEEFKEKRGKGVKAAEMLNIFMDEKNPELQSVLMADEKLTVKQKEIEEEKRKAEEARRQAEAEKADEEKTEKLLRVLEQTHQGNMEQLERKIRSEMNEQLEEREEQMGHKLRENELLIQQGFKDEADALYKEIRELKIQIRDQKAVAVSHNNSGIIAPFAATIGSILDSFLFPYLRK